MVHDGSTAERVDARLALTYVLRDPIVTIIFAIAYAAMVCGHVHGQAGRIGYVEQGC